MRKFAVKTAILIFSFCILYSAFFNIAVRAQENRIGEAQINAASPFYFLKSVGEILELKFAKTRQEKAFLQIKFLNERIREVNSLSKTSRQDLIEPTLEAYLATLNNLIGTANLTDENMASKVNGNITLQMDGLQKVYGQVSSPVARRFLRAAIFRFTEWDQRLVAEFKRVNQPLLSENIVKSRLTGCGFLSKEASSSALNEVERAILSERAQKCPTLKPQ